ncbi:CrcB protein [Halosimplex carlsbadense 2-9-1]|uniref:Fluoride-specific ion channel FluC n=1 Tax=Halosimplex carlsbadense 2-9-1 TaxID=797114 RepID=M0CVY9_9EURY|nr:fluoride efflux transporter CrcB [Halosimplex carlsbadense]ELZ26818.1 CrcB protein [Halosimplex carlsbadense 2-9-1]
MGVVNPVVLVGLGGVAGALARHLLGERIDARTGDTLAVNVLGSFALGALLAAPVGDAAVLALGTGFCGAFTTFSTFAFETVRLFETGQRRRALGNAAVNLVGALAAVWVGSTLASAVW